MKDIVLLHISSSELSEVLQDAFAAAGISLITARGALRTSEVLQEVAENDDSKNMVILWSPDYTSKLAMRDILLEINQHPHLSVLLNTPHHDPLLARDLLGYRATIDTSELYSQSFIDNLHIYTFAEKKQENPEGVTYGERRILETVCREFNF